MASNLAASYEETRRRHFSHMMELLPQYVARLQWSRAKIDTQQTQALRELLSHARDHSPWHRERLRNLDLDRLGPADLARIPSMTKNDLMADWDAIVTDPRCTLAAAEAHVATLTTDAYLLDDLHVIASGGSSGTRGVFVYDWDGWAVCWVASSRGLVASLQAARRLPSGPMVSVSAYVASHATSALTQTFSNPKRPTVRAPVTLALAEIVKILNASNPSILHSYPSMLPALCEEAGSGRLRIEPLLILCTAEPLLPEVRATAEATWNVPVLNCWAASESNGGAFPCPVGSGFHIGEDVNVIELVDDGGDPVPRGKQSAKILLTNLYNRIMPLIRYEITDEFELAEGPCACGSAYVKVADVQGRADDVFEYEGGVTVHPLNFRSLLGKERAIVEYQVRQTSGGAEVSIVGRSPIDVETLRAALEARLSNLGVATPQVIVRPVDRINRQSTGKLKRFIPLPR